MDLDYKRCPAEIPDSLDARCHGDKRHHRALLLELVALTVFWRSADRYSMGPAVVGKKTYP